MRHHFSRRLSALALALAMALSLCVTPAMADDPDVPVTMIRLAQTSLSLKVGQTAQLTASVRPTNATVKTIEWTSSDSSVLTVEKVTNVTDSKGVITAVTADVKAQGVGPATLTAAAMDGSGVTAQCAVTVTGADPSLKLEPTSLFLEAGQSGTVKAVTTGPVPSITWTPPRNAPFTLVENGDQSVTITAGDKKGSGTVRVDAVFTTGVDSRGNPVTKKLSESFRVDVADSTSNRVTDIKLNKDEITLVQDETYQLTATLTPSNAASREVEWTSSNEGVAKVDAKTGKVTAVSGGTATITAKPRYGDVQAYCDVTVTPAATGIGPIIGSGVTLKGDGTNASVYTFTRSSRSDTITVTAPLSPSASDDSVLWKSENATIATANGSGDQAVITRRGPGTVKITAVPVGPDGKARKGVEPAVLEVTVSGLVLEHTTLTMQENRRDTLAWTAFGDARTDSSTNCEWTTTDPAVVSVEAATGLLNARSKGEAVITATKSGYSASCTVKVVEDTTGVITLTGNHPAGTPVSMYSASATSGAGSGTLVSVLNAVSRAKTRTTNADGTQTAGYGLRYVTNLSVASTDQGILHDQHHSSADTGAGVGIQEIYYPSGSSSQGQRSLSDLSFVPKTSFSGTAEINYTGMAENSQTFTGVIRVTVNGTGDVMYSSTQGSVVNFLSDDFNLYHPNFRSLSFTPPLESRGTLYYNYSNPSQPGTKVTGSDTYSRTGTPSLDKVAFVPADRFNGTVTIPYTGTDTAGRAISGRVTITVTDNNGGSSAPGDLYYSMPQDGTVSFRPTDFSTACRSILGETLSYVRFTPPPSSEGTLFFNYRGFGSYDSAVASTTSYYYSGTPALSGVTFVPTTTTPSQVDIPYTGYSTRGNTFTGVIHIGQRGGTGTQQPGGLRYTVTTGRSVTLSASDFNSACVSATGASLNYVIFSPLPAVSQGTLRYTRGNSSTFYNLAASTRCYRAAAGTSDVQLGQVSFLSSTGYTGTVTLPFTGYSTTGAAFTGQAVITVNPPTSGDSVYSGTTANPIQLSSSQVRSASGGVLDGTLSYITFTSLPASSAGRLYLNYNGFGTGTQVTTGTRYYASGSPGIDQISFVPRGRFSGQATASYTAVNTNGRSVPGMMTFSITNSGSSSYFNDLGYHAWAAPAVDYLYRNGVTRGVTSTTFGPEQHILRCDFVLMLCRAFGFDGTGGYSFADVPANAYYAQAVAAAKQRGIVSGDGVNFMPNSELTRQDAMVMIKNALDAAGWNVPNASTTVLNGFPDGSSVSGYARTAVSTLVQMGAVSGDNGMLYPYNSITRAEAAVILHFVMTM